MDRTGAEGEREGGRREREGSSRSVRPQLKEQERQLTLGHIKVESGGAEPCPGDTARQPSDEWEEVGVGLLLTDACWAPRTESEGSGQAVNSKEESKLQHLVWGLWQVLALEGPPSGLGCHCVPEGFSVLDQAGPELAPGLTLSCLQGPG